MACVREHGCWVQKLRVQEGGAYMVSVNFDPNPKSSTSIISLAIALKQNKNNKKKQIVTAFYR